MSTPINDKPIRIVTQYRTRTAAVCELDLRGFSLDVHIKGATDDDPHPSTWTVEAHNGHGAEPVVIVGSGPTREAALNDAAALWNSTARARGLPEVDWNDVVDALRAVRAI